jgi:hypothetical protein
MRPWIRERRIVERTASPRTGGVAEAAQALFLLGRNRIGLRPIAAGRDPRERARELIVHALHTLRIVSGSIVALLWIVRQIEQLRMRTSDQLPVAGHPTAQRRPVHIQPAEEALGIQRIVDERTTPRRTDDRGKVASGQIAIRRSAGKGEQRRQDVDRRDRSRDDASSRNVRPRHDERHAHRRLIDQHAVRQLAVVAEAFSMIGEHDDIDVLVAAGRAKRVEDAADLLVGEGDLAVVRTAGKTTAEGFRRIVRGVRIVEMQPREERPRRALKPANRGVGHFVGASLSALFARTRFVKLLVEGVEALREPECRGDRIRADEGGGAVAKLLQATGRGRIPRSEREDDVAADAVGRRISTGEDRRVRRSGQRNRGLRAREARAARGERIERRRLGPGGAVHADVIRPQRVDGDEKKVALRRARGCVSPPERYADSSDRDESGGYESAAATHGE